MLFNIHTTTLETHKSASGKALYLTASYGGFNTGKSTEWFPISQLKISAPNECGWCEMEIPDWILKQKQFLGYANTMKCSFEEAPEK